MTVHFNTKITMEEAVQLRLSETIVASVTPKLREREILIRTDGERDEKREYKQRHKQRHSEWRRVIKKRCCLAVEDITSDTDVKLASSGTIRPLCCSPSGVQCVCGCQPLFLHPWTSSCLPYSPPSYTFLLLAVSPILPLHPALCITPPLHTSHTLTLPVLPFYLSVHHSVTENVLLFVSFPRPPRCQSYRLTSRTYCLTFTCLLISSIYVLPLMSKTVRTRRLLSRTICCPHNRFILILYVQLPVVPPAFHVELKIEIIYVFPVRRSLIWALLLTLFSVSTNIWPFSCSPTSCLLCLSVVFTKISSKSKVVDC